MDLWIPELELRMAVSHFYDKKISVDVCRMWTCVLPEEELDCFVMILEYLLTCDGPLSSKGPLLILLVGARLGVR